MTKKDVELVEVSPRDGLQNESVLLPTADKVELVARAVKAGLERIELTSFVNPVKVPQMADADAVAAGALSLAPAPSVLSLNLRGVERALAAGAREINHVFVASDSFSIRNNGAPTAATLEAWPGISALARSKGAKLCAVIATAFGCPFEGEVPAARLGTIAETLMRHAPDELTLADTIGVGVPAGVRERFGVVRKATGGGVPLRAHFHNTRNTGVANAFAAFEAGVTILDSSLAGIGGCPFAPGAAGNVATEDLVYMFERSGIRTGVDLDAAIAAALWIAGRLGKPPSGMVAKAGGFPKPA
jgi:hydroxymethylglutaryl-CoA lyase